MKIYTKTGDKGQTSLYGGERVSKKSLRLDSYGTVDELNSTIGIVRVYNKDKELEEKLFRLQNSLFSLGADLATPLSMSKEIKIVRIDEEEITELETEIDKWDSELEPLQVFILPGGTEAGAFLHLARTICRRAERLTVELSELEEINEFCVKFLNRLSDWLFVIARIANSRANFNEAKWQVK